MVFHPEMITNSTFSTTDSLDAKLIVCLVDEMRFDTHSRGKSVRDGNPIENYFSKRALLASGLEGSK